MMLDGGTGNRRLFASALMAVQRTYKQSIENDILLNLIVRPGGQFRSLVSATHFVDQALELPADRRDKLTRQRRDYAQP